MADPFFIAKQLVYSSWALQPYHTAAGTPLPYPGLLPGGYVLSRG